MFAKPTQTPRIMHEVLLAMLPGLAAMTYNYGWGIAFNVVVLSLLCLAVETLCVVLQNSPSTAQPALRHQMSDGTTLLAAWLMAICLPPWMPFIVLLTAAVAAIGLAKYAYGGLGQNIFNPAMVGYAVVLISFPQVLASWPGPQGAPDTLSGATLLSEFRYRPDQTLTEFAPSLAAFGSSHEWSATLFFAGGVWLIWRKIITWHIPVTMLACIGILAFFNFDQGSSTSLGSPWFHVTAGGAMAAAFFVATDPVTHPANRRHQMLFAGLIGLLTFVIRTQGAYPDGIAFAVLLANCTTPLLNRLHRQTAGLGITAAPSDTAKRDSESVS